MNIQVNILNIEYSRKNNIFLMTVKNKSDDQVMKFSINGKDLSISEKIPDEVINKFCADMKGKDKNLIIEGDKSSFGEIKSESDIKSDNIDRYPIRQTLYEIIDRGEIDES